MPEVPTRDPRSFAMDSGWLRADSSNTSTVTAGLWGSELGWGMELGSCRQNGDGHTCRRDIIIERIMEGGLVLLCIAVFGSAGFIKEVMP